MGKRQSSRELVVKHGYLVESIFSHYMMTTHNFDQIIHKIKHHYPDKYIEVAEILATSQMELSQSMVKILALIADSPMPTDSMNGMMELLTNELLKQRVDENGKTTKSNKE
jgi:L-lactate utilization protein LutC